MKPIRVKVNDLMQRGYAYFLTEPVGKNFHPDFKPQLTPKQMLELGVFGGKYMTDCANEFPEDWFDDAKLCPERHDPQLNHFGVNASQPLSVWREKGWIYEEDPRGWFQWYCRYYMGRRCPDDERQIKRWRLVKRHVAQVRKNCRRGDLQMPPPPTAGAATLGVRFAKDLGGDGGTSMTTTDPWLTATLEVVDGYRRMIDAAVVQLDDEELHRRPVEGINSVAVILRHLGGNLQSRWTDFLTTDGEKPTRNRDAEFEDWSGDRASLLNFFDSGWQTMRTSLAALSADDLNKDK